MSYLAKESVRQLVYAISAASSRCLVRSYSRSSALHRQNESNRIDMEREYAFEMACSNVRCGEGVTREVAMDLCNMGVKKVCVMTDSNVVKLPVMKTVLDALVKHSVQYDVFDRVRIEPTDTSVCEAIQFVKTGSFDGYVAVGGGSIIDTCKASNLYANKPDADLMDYVNAPIGRGLPITHKLKPMIAVPTTAGTGSESTSFAIFDYERLAAKVVIGSRHIRPTLALVDPINTQSMPKNVATYSAFDVLCHALESYTVLPYTDRTPRPSDPKERPTYQGSNPISDVWSSHALRIINKYMRRAINDCGDKEARFNMHLASVFAGIGFNNAGVHLCHGMSYPISGGVKTYQPDGYNQDHPIIPHGLSVVMTAPAVFKFTSAMCPERHLEAARLLGGDVTGVHRSDVGHLLSDLLRQLMFDLDVPDGLVSLGYTTDDIPTLVKGTLPQHRITKLAPRPPTEEDLANLFEQSMKIY